MQGDDFIVDKYLKDSTPLC